MGSSGRPVLVRAAASATITVAFFTVVLLYLVFKEGWDTVRVTNAMYLVSALWIAGWPFAILMSASKSLGTAWGRQLATGAPPDASTERPPSWTLASVGMTLFGLSVLTLGGLLGHACVQVVQEYQTSPLGGQSESHDPLEPPELPESFPASANPDALIAELDLDAVWTTTHPEYEGEIRILISSAPVEGMSPNYRGAFYRRDGDAFVRIGKGFGFGGYHPPELGRHPTLDVPAVVCLAEAVPERTYFFVHQGVLQTFQENGDTWIPAEDTR